MRNSIENVLKVTEYMEFTCKISMIYLYIRGYWMSNEKMCEANIAEVTLWNMRD